MALGSIPNDVRVPLVYIEIDNSQALSGNIAQDQQVMLFGQKLASGTAAALQVVEIPVSESAIDSLFGAGSMMARSARAFRTANSYTKAFALPLDDLAAGATPRWIPRYVGFQRYMSLWGQKLVRLSS